MNLKPRLLILILALAAGIPNSVLADDKDAWLALRDGKAIAIMRHAIAPGGGPASTQTREECQNERNLSDSGRSQARKIGELFRANGIANANVYSSSLCRCVDTATLLGFEQPEALPVINAFELGNESEQEQNEKLATWIKNAVEQQTVSNILVTHGFNISALTQNLPSQGDVLIIGVEQNQLVTLAQISTNAY